MNMASPPMKLHLMTWNVNGQSTRGSQARRDFVIRHDGHVLCLERKLLDITFFQEVTNRIDAERKWGITGGLYSIHKERRGIYQAIWSHEGHAIKEVINMEVEAHKLIPDRTTFAPTALEDADIAAGISKDLVIPDDKDRRLMRSDIPPRIHALKLLIGGRAEIIAVSFHSVYKCTYREHYILLFFNLMCRLADKHQCPVLIGGDFNLDVGKWKNHIEWNFNGRVNVSDYYTQTPRRHWKECIDTFAIVHPYPASIPGYIAMFEGPPVAVHPFPPQDNQDELRRLLPPGKELGSTLKKDLDHDPVKVTVKLVYTYSVIQMLLMGARLSCDSESDWDSDCYSDWDSDWDSDCYSDWDSDCYSDWDSDCYSDWDSDCYSDWDSDCYSDWDSDCYSHWDSDCYSDWDSDWDSDCYGDWDSDCYSDWDSDCYSDWDSESDYWASTYIWHYSNRY